MTILYILLMVFIIYFIVLFIVYKKVFLRSEKSKPLFEIKYTEKQLQKRKEISKEIKEYYKKNNENITIESYDGLKLHGKYFHQKDTSPIIVYFHGYRGNMLKDYSGTKKIVFDNGYNLLTVDQRAHGTSEGKSITFGIKERRDALMWANYIAKRYNKNKIILAGVSLGGATVLMSSDLPLPKNVVGIIADCPFSSPIEIINKILKDKKYPVKIFSKLVYLSGIIYGNLNIKAHDAYKSMKKTKLPILIIHGKNDNVVPYTMSEKLKKETKNKIELHSFDNADHAASYLEDDKRYEKIVLEFIKKVSK